MSETGSVTRIDQVPSALIRKYIDGCHILHYYDLVDAYGHLSVRISDSTFLMSRYLAPALVSSPDDLVIYSVDTGEAVNSDAPKGFSERFIHSELYKAYPGAQSVVHSHSLAVVPFSISSTPLSACFHMAGFLGRKVPVWDIGTVYTESDQQHMLVRNTKHGASLAKSLGEGSELKHSVALMRGHGMVVVAENIEMVVFKCIYTVQNAKVQQSALGLGGSVQLFTQREADDTANTTAAGAVKPWPLWTREVEKSTLYQNLA